MTPEQVLELVAASIEAHREAEAISRELNSTWPDRAPFDDESFVAVRNSHLAARDRVVQISQQLLALNPALIRSQAAALAEAEARENRLRKAIGVYITHVHACLGIDDDKMVATFTEALKGAAHAE